MVDWGGCWGWLFNFHTLLALEGLSHPGGRYRVAACGLMAAAGVNCARILDKTEKGDDTSDGLI